ncbi:MAG: NAD(P)/FAD-dependent oxidoreductase [Nocardioides sp.]|uniref:NAD(P)/FAD-dependent oxidoreductase n=1 Tax=Nocardioides sp. TaxID=35761 RepID=UPI003F119EE2
MDKSQTLDVVVIGTGSAGLQAALTLGRMHQRTVVLTSGEYRNDPTGHMHNFLGHDGDAPGDLRDAGLADLAAYEDVEVREGTVVAVGGAAGEFEVELAGGERLRARRVLLATGVRDTLPEVPGLAENFGGLVAHCPFCHGHEYAGRPVGLLGVGPHTPMMTSMLRPISEERVLLTDGVPVEGSVRGTLGQLGVTLVEAPVTGVVREGDELLVSFDGHEDVRLGGMLVKTDWEQTAGFVRDLGLEVSEFGAVLVDAFGRTSVPGIYAAGDMAQGPGLPMPMAAVLVAASGGLLAAAACVQDAAAEALAV